MIKQSFRPTRPIDLTEKSGSLYCGNCKCRTYAQALLPNTAHGNSKNGIKCSTSAPALSPNTAHGNRMNVIKKIRKRANRKGEYEKYSKNEIKKSNTQQ